MSQIENMAVPTVGNMSKEELLELKKAMNAKALAKRRTKTALRVTANVVFAVLILLPLLYAISIALMPSSELFTTELNLFPKNPTFSNFINAFRTVPLLRFILNSFIMAGCITIGQIITCSLAAFAFSFLEFKGKGILFMVVMATMMVPGEATIISNYLTVSGWGMLDTYQVLIVPYLTSAMGIFLFRQFYMTFPISLYESAKLDGCGNLKFSEIYCKDPASADEIRYRCHGSVYLYQCMEYVHVATACNRLQQYENRSDRYQYAGQCGFTVHHPDDRRCSYDHHSVHFHLYHWTETADQRNVLGCSQGLISEQAATLQQPAVRGKILQKDTAKS